MEARAGDLIENETKNKGKEKRISLPRFLLELENLALGGGGAAGLSEVGAIRYLSLAGLDFMSLIRVIGVSVGAPGAFAIACDMPPDSMFTRLAQLDFKKLLDKGSIPRAALRFFWERKVCAGTEIQNELAKFYDEQTSRLNNLREKAGKSPIALPDDPRDISFRHLRRLGCKELFIVTSALYKYKGKQAHAEKKIWSHLSTPDASVFWATIASMSLPGLFEGVTFICDENNQYRVVSNTSTDPRAVTHVDGGVVDNLPHELFDNEFWISHMSNYLMDLDEDGCANGCEAITYFEKPVGTLKTKAMKNPHTLAIAINPEVSKEEKIPFRSSELRPLAQACINGMLISGKLDYHIRHEADGDRLITINSPIATTQFDADEELQHQALLAGANAVAKKFDLPEPDPRDYILPKRKAALPAPELTVEEIFPPTLSHAESFLMWGHPAYMLTPNNRSTTNESQDEDEKPHISPQKSCLMM